jgi:hypothetical protein
LKRLTKLSDGCSEEKIREICGYPLFSYLPAFLIKNSRS